MSIKFERRVQTSLFAIFSVVAVSVVLISMSDDDMNMFKALAGLVCFVGFMLFSRNKKLKGKGFLLGVAGTLLMFISMIYNENARAVNILWIWAYLGAALILYEYGIPKWMAFAIFYAFSLSFCLVAFQGKLQYNELLQHGSANNVSILLIYCMFLYYISLKDDQTKLMPYIPILIVSFLSLWTANRSGILTCGVFFLVVFYFNNKSSSKRHSRWKNVLMIFALIAIVVYFVLHLSAQFDVAMETKMDRQGMSSARSILWTEYIRGTFDSLGNLFLGVPGNKYLFLSYYNGNPHNSLLVAHSKFGLVGFFVVLYVIFKTGWISFKRKEWVITATLILVVTRSFFDWTAFPGLYDVLFWCFLLYAFDNDKGRNKSFSYKQKQMSLK